MWTLYNAQYDLDEFVVHHPGGAIAILLGKNIDTTSLFESYHIGNSRKRAFAMAQRYRISREKMPVPHISPFKRDLDAMLEDHFTTLSPRASWFHMFVCFLLFYILHSIYSTIYYHQKLDSYLFRLIHQCNSLAHKE